MAVTRSASDSSSPSWIRSRVVNVPANNADERELLAAGCASDLEDRADGDPIAVAAAVGSTPTTPRPSSGDAGARHGRAEIHRAAAPASGCECRCKAIGRQPVAVKKGTQDLVVVGRERFGEDVNVNRVVRVKATTLASRAPTSRGSFHLR